MPEIDESELLEESEDEEETIEQPNRSHKKKVDPNVIKTKEKVARTPKQIEAFKKALETKSKNAKKRNDDAKRLSDFERQALEEKIVKKAVSIKKKQIKKQIALDEISDDDTPIERIQELKNRAKPVQNVVVKPIKPSFNFI